MGEGVAQSFAEAGLSVHLIDLDQSAIERCLLQIASNLRLSEEFGLLSEPPDRIASRVVPCAGADILQAVADCGLVVETVPEVLEIKRELFARLDAAPATTILASNTSSFTITDIAGGMRTAERVLGMHYFNPAHIIPAVEIHRGARTSDAVVEAARALLVRAGKIPVLVKKELPGFIINRLTGALEREIDYLLDQGVVSPEDLDRAVKASLGFRLACLGPMEAEDFIGLDTAARVSRNIFRELSNKTEPSALLLEKVERKELGVKTGQGWYDYRGRTREEVLNERNRRLLRQLALFRAERIDK